MAEASVVPSELRGAVVAGTVPLNIGATAATVDLTLPTAQCQSVRLVTLNSQWIYLVEIYLAENLSI